MLEAYCIKTTQLRGHLFLFQFLKITVRVEVRVFTGDRSNTCLINVV